MTRTDRSAAVAAFMRDLDRLIGRQPELFEAGDVVVGPSQHKFAVLDENQGDIDIDAMNANQPGEGWGGIVLKLITALADRYGLDIYIRAYADEETEHPESISQGDLEAFYSENGFVDVGSWDIRDMIRRPVGPPFVGAASDAQLLLLRALQGDVIWQAPASPRP
jgi:hypothetical protein